MIQHFITNLLLHSSSSVLSLSFIVINFLHLGSPPHCELCHSPCYDNWQKYIENEENDIAQMKKNVTDLLSKFGGMTYEHIETELSLLNGNLTMASKVFSGARYNTSAMEQQFKKVSW